MDPGTDLEDELPSPAASPVATGHGVAPLPAQAEVDIDLEQVFGDVGSLPAMVTPVCDFDRGAWCDSGGVSCACASWCVSHCGAATDGDLPGWADSHVSWFSTTIDGVGGLFVGTDDNSGGVHAGEEPVAQGC